MTPDELARLVAEALGRVGAPGAPLPPTVRVVPAPDGPAWRSAAALRAAPSARMPPATLAGSLADELGRHHEVEGVTVRGDGLLDIALTPSAAGAVVARVLGDPAYGVGEREPFGPRPTLPLSRRPEEPVFLVVWARSRAGRAADLAAAQGLSLLESVADHLSHPTERALLTAVAAFPDDVAHARDAPALLRRLADDAGRTHAWLDACPVLPRTVDERVTDTHRARLALARTTAQVLTSGLRLLRLPAPAQV